MNIFKISKLSLWILPISLALGLGTNSRAADVKCDWTWEMEYDGCIYTNWLCTDGSVEQWVNCDAKPEFRVLTLNNAGWGTGKGAFTKNPQVRLARR